MKKAAVLSILVAVAVLAVGVIAEAQQPKKVPLIGFLGRPSLAAIKPLADAFRQGLRELGYVEGQSLAIEKVVRCKLTTMGPKFSECREANQVKKNKDLSETLTVPSKFGRPYPLLKVTFNWKRTQLS